MIRSDGRAADQLRPIQIIRHYTKHAPGSVLICVGDTQVLVTASIEDRVPKHIFDAGSGGWLTAEYSMLPGATNTRNQRDRLKVSGRTMEIQRLIGRSLRCAVDLTKIGQRTITIDADVLQADGGTRVASITGAYVALVDCLETLKNKGVFSELPILAPVAAISVGILDGTPILDLNYEEDSTADVDANVIMNGMGNIIEFQATSERTPFPPATLLELLNLAEQGTCQLFEAQTAALAESYTSLSV